MASIRRTWILFALALLLPAFGIAGTDRVANFFFGEPGTKRYEHFSFWVHDDSRTEIIYSYGIHRKKMKLKSLKRLQEADLLFMPGSTDPSYTASKLYPYIMAKKAILALFNDQSSVVDILAKTRAGEVVTFRNDEKITHVGIRLQPVLTALLEKLPFQPATDWEAFEPFTAREMTRQQCDFFDKVVEKSGFQVLPPPDPPRDTEESPEPPGRRSPS